MSARIQLSRPVTVGGRTIDTVTVRRPDGRDRAILGEALLIVANLPDHPDDIARANRIIAAHLSDLGLAALSIDDPAILQPVIDQVFHYVTRDE